MGRIFRTPSDDAVEETLRSMHIANTVDVAYERSLGWVRTVLFSVATAFVISGYEFYRDWSLWETTGEWVRETLRRWADSIFN